MCLATLLLGKDARQPPHEPYVSEASTGASYSCDEDDEKRWGSLMGIKCTRIATSIVGG